MDKYEIIGLVVAALILVINSLLKINNEDNKKAKKKKRVLTYILLFLGLIALAISGFKSYKTKQENLVQLNEERGKHILDSINNDKERTIDSITSVDLKIQLKKSEEIKRLTQELNTEMSNRLSVQSELILSQKRDLFNSRSPIKDEFSVFIIVDFTDSYISNHIDSMINMFEGEAYRFLTEYSHYDLPDQSKNAAYEEIVIWINDTRERLFQPFDNLLLRIQFSNRNENSLVISNEVYDLNVGFSVREDFLKDFEKRAAVTYNPHSKIFQLQFQAPLKIQRQSSDFRVIDDFSSIEIAVCIDIDDQALNRFNYSANGLEKKIHSSYRFYDINWIDIMHSNTKIMHIYNLETSDSNPCLVADMDLIE